MFNLAQRLTREEIFRRARMSGFNEERLTKLIDGAIKAGVLQVFEDGSLGPTEKGAELAAHAEEVRDRLRPHLYGDYVVNGFPVKGNALSYLMKNSRYDRLGIPSQYYPAVAFLEKYGFKVERGTNNRNQACEVVHEPVKSWIKPETEH